MTQSSSDFKGFLKNGLGARFLMICALIILLNIPLGMVNGIIDSRVVLYNRTVREISNDWGGSQKIMAPVLVVPTQRPIGQSYYGLHRVDGDEQPDEIYESVIILPETLYITAQVHPDKRYRGIFNVLVHTTDIQITGNFEKPDLSFVKSGTKILWDKAVLSLGIDPSLIRGNPQMFFGDQELTLLPGSKMDGIEGVSAIVSVNADTLNKPFDLKFKFNGSDQISLAPIAKNNTFEVTSAWPHPLFSGTFRPDNPHISNDGFKAVWNIPSIARDYPQAGYVGSEMKNMQTKVATIALFEEMPVQKQVERLSKYGIIFITLTFIMMFLFETNLKRRMHYIQYGVIGLAISLFFLTVLSVSQYLSFGWAYAIASSVVLVMIALYVYGALKNKGVAFASALVMAFLYLVLYVMLSEGQFALLIGTFILLLTMAAVMWATRNMNEQFSVDEDGNSSMQPEPLQKEVSQGLQKPIRTVKNKKGNSSQKK